MTQNWKSEGLKARRGKERDPSTHHEHKEKQNYVS